MGFKRSRVQIPAARFSEAWGIFFGLKGFAEIAEFGRFGSSRWPDPVSGTDQI
jgi:hypothetical protein